MSSQLTATELLSLHQTTKEERETFAQEVVRNMENGAVDALKVHCQIKSMEQLIETLKENASYKDMVLDAAGKYGKRFSLHNAEFQVKEAGVQYDWSKTGDTQLLDWMDKYEQLGKLIKSRQNILKAVTASGILMTDEDTGETTRAYPPAKTSTTVVSVNLK